jgi:hypothetical protein
MGLTRRAWERRLMETGAAYEVALRLHNDRTPFARRIESCKDADSIYRPGGCLQTCTSCMHAWWGYLASRIANTGYMYSVFLNVYHEFICIQCISNTSKYIDDCKRSVMQTQGSSR